jgi:hypothetical protein
MSIYEGSKPLTVRTWGRDRLQTLARLIPACRTVEVYLAGFGLPSIYVLDLGPVQFTLALSGWTDNDWTAGGSKFDLLARRLEVTTVELTKTYEAIRALRSGSDVQIAQSAGLGVEKVRSALSFLCQVGRAMFDLAGGVYRHRDLFLEPFSASEAAKAVKPAISTNPKESAAQTIFAGDDIRIIARRPVSTGFKLSGSARGDEGPRVRPLLHADHEGRIIEGSCTCRFYRTHQLTRGPCEHILALRLAHMSRLEREDGTVEVG